MSEPINSMTMVCMSMRIYMCVRVCVCVCVYYLADGSEAADDDHIFEVVVVVECLHVRTCCAVALVCVCMCVKSPQRYLHYATKSMRVTSLNMYQRYRHKHARNVTF